MPQRTMTPILTDERFLHWFLRVATPAMLDLAGRTEDAARLRAGADLTDPTRIVRGEVVWLERLKGELWREYSSHPHCERKQTDLYRLINEFGSIASSGYAYGTPRRSHIGHHAWGVASGAYDLAVLSGCTPEQMRESFVAICKAYVDLSHRLDYLPGPPEDDAIILPAEANPITGPITYLDLDSTWDKEEAAMS